MLNSIPRTSLAEQQAKNMYTISSSFCNMNTNPENLLHDQSDIKCTRIIWFTEIRWKAVGKGFFQIKIKSMLLGKEKNCSTWWRHWRFINTINDPPFSMISHEFEKMTQIDAWMISIHVKVFHDDERESFLKTTTPSTGELLLGKNGWEKVQTICKVSKRAWIAP